LFYSIIKEVLSFGKDLGEALLLLPIYFSLTPALSRGEGGKLRELFKSYPLERI